jgi:tripartite-type tricarboxylate transporter receptor subunit TctC
VQLVVAYPPGGLGDIVAHALSEGLASALGQPVTVENRPGASGAVGAQSVARAAPDGRTLLVGQTAEVAIDPNLAKNLGYEPARDLEPVALAAVVPLALVVPAKAPYATLEDLLEAARTSPRGLSFASAGPGTPGHFAGELLRLRRTSRLTHVPYDGAGPALEDLVRGRVDFYFASLPSAMPYVTAGKLKILALSSARRSPAVPTIPTVEEAGIKNFDITLWAGIFAPRGTPREMVQRLNQEINQILGRPEVRDPLRRDGAEITPMSADQFADFVSSEASKYAKITLDDFCSRFMFGGCVGYGLYNPL